MKNDEYDHDDLEYIPRKLKLRASITNVWNMKTGSWISLILLLASSLLPLFLVFSALFGHVYPDLWDITSSVAWYSIPTGLGLFLRILGDSEEARCRAVYGAVEEMTDVHLAEYDPPVEKKEPFTEDQIGMLVATVKILSNADNERREAVLTALPHLLTAPSFRVLINAGCGDPNCKNCEADKD